MPLFYTHLDSPLGRLLLTCEQDRLTGLYFADQPHAPAPGRDWIKQSDAIFVQTAREIEEYANGRRVSFDVPIGLRGTAFQMRVWREISAIPFGQTITYGELAQHIGSPQAMRAAGTATGANPVSWFVPCHRVVGSDGSLTGYAGGMERKAALLEFESARAAGREVELALGELALA